MMIIPTFAVKVINPRTGRAVTIPTWNARAHLYQFVGGLEDGEQGTLADLLTYVDVGLVVLHWLIASERGDLFVKTHTGYQSTRSLIA